MKHILLFLANFLIHPFKIATYGEEYSPKFFGIQNKKGTLLLTSKLTESWSTWQSADIGAYFYPTKPKEIVNFGSLLKLAIKFNLYRFLSPVLALEVFETKKPERVFAPAFFEEFAMPGLFINKEHTHFTAIAHGNRGVYVNGHNLIATTRFNIDDHSLWKIEIHKDDGTKIVAYLSKLA